MSDYERDIAAHKKRAKRSGYRDPHMFVAITRNRMFEFWYGIHGPAGEHRRFAVPLDVAYVFMHRQLAKLERLYDQLKMAKPVVETSDVDAYIHEALDGEPEKDGHYGEAG